MSDLISDDQKIIWDLCCDHGKLGRELALRTSVEKVYLVDRVPEIVELLHRKKKIPKTENICLDAGDVKIANHAQETLVIAGVGAMTAMKMMKSIRDRHQPFFATFIVSVHRDREPFKAFLKNEKFEITQEVFVEDAGRSYQILKIIAILDTL